MTGPASNRGAEANSAHAVMAGEFRQVHKDPFDRVLAAQAITEGFGLAMGDRAMGALGADMVWG
jgi:PIN domain nuclease of toxin-antitoxin system